MHKPFPDPIQKAIDELGIKIRNDLYW
ncbi:HAD family hydrolase [Enterococcus lactis]|nr:HAD family hydrolase [Enterococcus lactis]